MDCLFCRIVEKKIPATILYEDDRVLSFRDIAPQAPTHILTIPKQHITTLNDIGEQDTLLLGHMIQTARQLASAQGLAEDGYRLVFNCNNMGGQSVYHIHLHLLGGRQMSWPPG